MKLQETVNIFIHCAASVDFNARLDDAIHMNILGNLVKIIKIKVPWKHMKYSDLWKMVWILSIFQPAM